MEHRDHRQAHEATLLQGQVFPACAICHDAVRFVLKYRAIKIEQDKDFPPAG